MAELQTVTAAWAVVKLAMDVIGLVQKLVKANAEAQTLLDKVEQMGQVNKNVAILLKTRQERRRHASPPELEFSLEQRIHESVEACKKCLANMQRTLQPLRRVSTSTLLQGAAGSVKNLLNLDFIRNQERIVDKHVDSISLSLTLLHSVDQAATHALLQSLVNLLDVNARGRQELPTHRSVIHSEDHDDPVSNGRPNNSSENQNQLDASDHSGQEAPTTAFVEDVGLPSTSEEQAKLLQVAEKALMVAVKENQYAEVVNLLTTSEDSQSLYYVDVEHWTVLHHAVRIQSPDILKKLLGAWAAARSDIVNKRNRQGETALMIAAKHSGTEEAVQMARLLLNAGCDPNLTNKADQTALYFAIEGPPHKEEEELADLLVDNGADVTVVYDKIPEQVEKYHKLEKVVRLREARSGDNHKASLSGRVGRALSTVVSRKDQQA